MSCSLLTPCVLELTESKKLLKILIMSTQRKWNLKNQEQIYTLKK